MLVLLKAFLVVSLSEFLKPPMYIFTTWNGSRQADRLRDTKSLFKILKEFFPSPVDFKSNLSPTFWSMGCDGFNTIFLPHV